MKHFLKIGLLSATLAVGAGGSVCLAEDENCAGGRGAANYGNYPAPAYGAYGTVDGGSRQKGRIVTKVNRTCLGAAAPPAFGVAVQHVPPMMAAPYVMTMQTPMMGAAYPAYYGAPFGGYPYGFQPPPNNFGSNQNCSAPVSCSPRAGCNGGSGSASSSEIAELREQMREIRNSVDLALAEIQKRPLPKNDKQEDNDGGSEAADPREQSRFKVGGQK